MGAVTESCVSASFLHYGLLQIVRAPQPAGALQLLHSWCSIPAPVISEQGQRHVASSLSAAIAAPAAMHDKYRLVGERIAAGTGKMQPRAIVRKPVTDARR